jgi:hypothetical protein
MISSLILYDFLLAVMIVCLELYESRNEPVVDQGLRVKQYFAIKQAHDIWVSRSSSSKEAQRASTIIASLLSKVHAPSASATCPVVSPAQPVSKLPNQFLPTAPDVLLENHTLDFGISDIQSTNYFDSMFCESDNIDWVSLRKNSFTDRLPNIDRALLINI